MDCLIENNGEKEPRTKIRQVQKQFVYYKE